MDDDKLLHYSFCKERPQRDKKKKKEHQRGVGQGPSSGQAASLKSISFSLVAEEIVRNKVKNTS